MNFLVALRKSSIVKRAGWIQWAVLERGFFRVIASVDPGTKDAPRGDKIAMYPDDYLAEDWEAHTR